MYKRQLEEGQPCPVCGSTEHPVPAAKPETAPTEEALEAAKQASDEAAAEMSRRSAEAGSFDGQTKAKREELENKADQFFDQWKPESLAEQLQDCLLYTSPLRDMREIKGTYEELTAKSFYEGTDYQESYLHITLTDEEDIPDAIGKLRAIYRNIMKLDYDNARTRASMEIDGAEDLEQKSPLDLLGELYEKQNNQPKMCIRDRSTSKCPLPR